MANPYSIYMTRSQTDANAPAVDGTAVSSTTTFYSDLWSGQNADGQSLSVFYTGTPTGTFTLWFTDKPNPNLANDNDWEQDAGFSPTNPAGAAGKFGASESTAKGFRKRLKYVNSAGSGTIFAYVTVPRMR